MRCDTLPTFVRILMCFLLIWQVVSHVSDASLAMLIVFFHHFFRLLSSMEESSGVISTLARFWPKTLGSMHKVMGFEKEEFVQYVVCPKCHSIYDYSDCFMMKHGIEVSKTCQHCPFPQHPNKSQRKPCGAVLLQSIKTKTSMILRPWKVYCYRSLVTSLQQIPGTC